MRGRPRRSGRGRVRGPKARPGEAAREWNATKTGGSGYAVGVSKRPGKHGDGTELSFEEALAQLEAIVEKIEGGEVGLESALAEYERGVALLKRCREVLERAEQKVEELSSKVEERPGKDEEDRDDEAPF